MYPSKTPATTIFKTNNYQSVTIFGILFIRTYPLVPEYIVLKRSFYKSIEVCRMHSLITITTNFQNMKVYSFFFTSEVKLFATMILNYK